MKNIIYMCLILFLVGCSDKSNVQECESAGFENPFSHKLTSEIENLIKKTIEKYGENPERLYSVSFSLYDEFTGDCFVKISSDLFYSKQDIDGYTYINDKLIVCYNVLGYCNDNMVNKDALIPFVDSIAGFKDYSQADMEYEMVTNIFKIIDNDNFILSEAR